MNTCLICADTGVLDFTSDLVRPCPYCSKGRTVGPLLAADQRKEVGKENAYWRPSESEMK